MTTLREAAQAVLDRWDSPAWEWQKQGPTADLMAELRAALAQEQAGSWHDGVLEGHLRERERWLAQEQAEPTLSQQLADAGFKPRDTRLECDECGGKFTRQMLPIHKCEPAQEQAEPVAWINVELDVLASHPACWGREDEAWTALYTAPPQRKPLTDDEIMELWQRHIGPISFARAVEKKVRGE